jgi:hypothetical protein
LDEGRAEAGLEKLLCLFRLAQHFYGQGNPGDYHTGEGMASAGLRRFRRLVITEEVTPEWLDKFEAVLPPVEDMSMKQSREVDEVRMLYEQEYQRSLLERLRRMFTQGTRSRGTREPDLIHLGQCRAARILLALRRYRNETGTWPADLRALDARLPRDAFLDPLSGKPPDDFLFWPCR